MNYVQVVQNFVRIPQQVVHTARDASPKFLVLRLVRATRRWIAQVLAGSPASLTARLYLGTDEVEVFMIRN